MHGIRGAASNFPTIRREFSSTSDLKRRIIGCTALGSTKPVSAADKAETDLLTIQCTLLDIPRKPGIAFAEE
eukprot:2804849-Amphidinium_carterae.1